MSFFKLILWIWFIQLSWTLTDGRSWRPEDYPNPNRIVNGTNQCGSMSTISICNPDGVITFGEAQQLQSMINKLSNETQGDVSCGKKHYTVAVGILNEIDLGNISTKGNPKATTKNYKTSVFANYLREKSWKFGDCGEDIYIVLTTSPVTIVTSTGVYAERKLTESCILEITHDRRVQQFIAQNDYAAALHYVLNIYQEILISDGSQCPEPPLTILVVSLVLSFFVISVTLLVISHKCPKKGNCKACHNGISYKRKPKKRDGSPHEVQALASSSEYVEEFRA